MRPNRNQKPKGAAACVALYLLIALAPTTRAAELNSEQRSASAPVRGIVRAVHQASLATDVPMRVKRLVVREAQSFRKGDVLIEFDCHRLEADVRAAQAARREMHLALESNLYLDQKGAIGRLDVEVSRARADKAAAEEDSLRARSVQCKVSAPFDGRVVDLFINEHEFPAAGKPFMTIVNEADFEIDLIVPSNRLRFIRPGDTFPFSIDETGRTYAAKVFRTGAAIDPVSQTVKVIAQFDTAAEDVLSGMTGNALLPHPEQTP